MNLIIEPNLSDPDAAFEALIAAHRGLSEADSASLDARLILILVNHIGSLDVLHAALDLAKDPAPKPAAE